MVLLNHTWAWSELSFRSLSWARARKISARSTSILWPTLYDAEIPTTIAPGHRKRAIAKSNRKKMIYLLLLLLLHLRRNFQIFFDVLTFLTNFRKRRIQNSDLVVFKIKFCFGRKQNKGIGKRFYHGSGSFCWLPWQAFKIDGMGSNLESRHCLNGNGQCWALVHSGCLQYDKHEFI